VSKVLISKINVSKLIKEIFDFKFIIYQQKLTLSKINVSKLIKKIFDFRFIIYQQKLTLSKICVSRLLIGQQKYLISDYNGSAKIDNFKNEC
jgi:hypothetical protein